jgi:small subunit ribosomal protein S16
MLTIRFARVGKKNKAQYKIVLQEHTVAPGGRHVEILGSYDPHSKVAVIKEDRVKYWVEKGAQASDSAHNLLVSKGIVKGEKRKVKIPEKPAPEVPAEEAKKEEEKKEEVKPEEAKVEAPTEEAKPEEAKS